MFQLVLFGYFYSLLALNRIQDPGSVQYALNLLAQHQYNAHHAWLGSTLNVQHLKHQKNARNTTPGLDHAAIHLHPLHLFLLPPCLNNPLPPATFLPLVTPLPPATLPPLVTPLPPSKTSFLTEDTTPEYCSTTSTASSVK